MEENAAAMSPDFTLTEEDMTALTNMDQVSKQLSSKENVIAVLACSFSAADGVRRTLFKSYTELGYSRTFAEDRIDFLARGRRPRWGS